VLGSFCGEQLVGVALDEAGTGLVHWVCACCSLHPVSVVSIVSEGLTRSYSSRLIGREQEDGLQEWNRESELEEDALVAACCCPLPEGVVQNFLTHFIGEWGISIASS
jgi:hypothetical protein